MLFKNSRDKEFVGGFVPDDQWNKASQAPAPENHDELRGTMIETTMGISRRINSGADVFVLKKPTRCTDVQAIIEDASLISHAHTELRNIDAFVNEAKGMNRLVGNDTDLMERFWDSVESMENLLEFLVVHLRHIQHTPDLCTDKSGIISPYSWHCLATYSNFCDNMIDEMLALWKEEFGRFVAGEDLDVPDSAMFDEALKNDALRDISGDETSIKAVKAICSEVRLRRLQIRMASIITHVSQATRSKFCGVQYGFGEAYSVLQESTAASSELLQRLAEAMDLSTVEHSTQTLQAKSEVYADVEHLLRSVTVSCVVGEALAIGCMSPIIIGECFLSGWRVKIGQMALTKHSVTLEMLDSEGISEGKGHSTNANEYLEYDRQKSISVELMKHEDPTDHQNIIFEGVERTYVVMGELLHCECGGQKAKDSGVDRADSALPSTTKVGDNATIVAFAAGVLLSVVLKEETRWQVCAGCVYPKISVPLFAKWMVSRRPCFEMCLQRLGGIEEAQKMDIQVLIGKAFLGTSTPMMGVSSDLMQIKLSYLGILEAVDLADGSPAVFDLNKIETSARPLIRAFHPRNIAVGSSRGELSSSSRDSHSPLEALVQVSIYFEEIARNEMILGLFLELTAYLLSFDPFLALSTYECHARCYAKLRTAANAHDEHHRVAVLASRVQAPERSIWHCKFILNHLHEGTSGLSSNASLKLLYRTIKVLVAQYCSISDFDAAHESLTWALNYMRKNREMSALENPDNIPSLDVTQELWIDDLQVSIARVHLLNGCPDECAEVIQEYLASSPEMNTNSQQGADIREGALALLTKAYLDMDDIMTATKLIMVIKNARTELKAFKELIKRQLEARGGSITQARGSTRYKQLRSTPKKGTHSETISSVSSDRKSTPSKSDTHVSLDEILIAENGVLNEFYINNFPDFYLTYMPQFCIQNLHTDMGALQAVTLMKGKSYAKALNAIVHTIIGVELTMNANGDPEEGLSELASLYMLRGTIAFEASTRCACVEFPFSVDASSTYSILKNLTGEHRNESIDLGHDSARGYGKQSLQFAAPSDLLRDAIVWFDRSIHLFNTIQDQRGSSEASYHLSQCYLEALFVPTALLGSSLTSAKDISPPLVKSLAGNHMDFVYNMDVNEGGDFGGLFGQSQKSLSDGDGIMGNLLGLANVDDISSLSRADTNYISLKSTAQYLRSALSSATKTRNIPMMIDAYLSGAELKFVRGDKPGAEQSWYQARNLFFSIFVVGTSIPLARRASLPHLRNIEKQLNRLIRFLWVCDKLLINANILLLDVHTNFGIEMNMAVRHNAMLAHRTSFNLGNLLLKLEKQVSLSRLAEHNTLQQTANHSGTSLIDGGEEQGKGEEDNGDVVSSVTDEMTSKDIGTATSEMQEKGAMNQTGASDAGSGESSESDLSTGRTPSLPNTANSHEGETKEPCDNLSTSRDTATEGSVDSSRSGMTAGSAYNPTTMPNHLSVKSANLQQISPLRVVRQASVIDSFRTSTTHNGDMLSPNETHVIELWRTWLRLCRAPVLKIKVCESFATREMENVYTSLSNFISRLQKDLGAINALVVSFDQLEARHRESTAAKFAAFSEHRGGGMSKGPGEKSEVFAVDKGLHLCRTVFALKVNELMMMYHPFTGRKDVRLIGCANFASYSDATASLENRLKPLIASINLHTNDKIEYKCAPKNHAGRQGYIVDQVLLGAEFYNLQKETAVAVESMQCCGGPQGRMIAYEKIKSGHFSHAVHFLRWVCDPSLYEPLSNARGNEAWSGNSHMGYNHHSSPQILHQGNMSYQHQHHYVADNISSSNSSSINDRISGITSDSSGSSRSGNNNMNTNNSTVYGDRGPYEGQFGQQHFREDARGQTHFGDYGHGLPAALDPSRGGTGGRMMSGGSVSQGKGMGFKDILSRSFNSFIESSATNVPTMNTPICIVASSSLQILPWELFVSREEIVVRGINFLAGLRPLRSKNFLGPEAGLRPVFVGCALGLTGMPVKLKTDIQSADIQSRELGVAYGMNRLQSIALPRKSQWYEPSRRKPPFDLLSTRVPAEIITKYINVANSYWRQELPYCVPLVPLGKTCSQPLRSKSLRRVSFVDLCDTLCPTANYDASMLLELIKNVKESTLVEEKKFQEAQSNEAKFFLVFFAYADVMELSASVSQVLSGKGDNLVAIFLPHFCVSQVAKEIIRSVDNCIVSRTRSKDTSFDNGAVGAGIQAKRQHAHGMAREYGIPGPMNNPSYLQQQQEQHPTFGMPGASPGFDYSSNVMPPPPGYGGYRGGGPPPNQAPIDHPSLAGTYGGMYHCEPQELPRQESWNHVTQHQVVGEESLVYHAMFEAVKSSEASLMTHIPVFF